LSTLNVTLISIGSAALLAAVVGGGLTIAGTTVPVLRGWKQQVPCGVVGFALLALGLFVNGDMRQVNKHFRIDPESRTEEVEGVVFCYWNITPYSPAGVHVADLKSDYDELHRDLQFKVGIYRMGTPSASCDETGPHYHFMRQGESLPLRHPKCTLTVTATKLYRGLKAGHSWDEYFQAGAKGVDRSSWYDSWAELRVAGECPEGGKSADQKSNGETAP
jgi:hypothetical protein